MPMCMRVIDHARILCHGMNHLGPLPRLRVAVGGQDSAPFALPQEFAGPTVYEATPQILRVAEVRHDGLLLLATVPLT